MAQLIHTTSLAGILQPAQEPGDARQDAVQWTPSITVSAGDIIAIHSGTKKAIRYVAGGANETGIGKGLAMYSFVTDANGLVFISGSTTASPINTGDLTSPIWKTGIFDVGDVKIGGVAAVLADIETAFGDRGFVMHNGFYKLLG